MAWCRSKYWRLAKIKSRPLLFIGRQIWPQIRIQRSRFHFRNIFGWWIWPCLLAFFRGWSSKSRGVLGNSWVALGGPNLKIFFSNDNSAQNLECECESEFYDVILTGYDVIVKNQIWDIQKWPNIHFMYIIRRRNEFWIHFWYYKSCDQSQKNA